MLLELIIYAAIAVFMLWRLYTLLGSRDGFDRQDSGWLGQKRRDATADQDDQAVEVIDTTAERIDGDGAHHPEQSPKQATKQPNAQPRGQRASGQGGTKLLQKLDPTFDPDRFLAGAQGAFRLIVEAFAKADWPALEPYVTPPMAQEFRLAHQALVTAQQRQEQNLLDIRQATLDQVWLQGADAFIRVRFVSEQIMVIYDQNQQVVDGHPTNPVVMEDLWTFTRPLASRDPQWWLTAVDEPEEADTP